MITFPEYARVGRVVAKENFYDKIDYSTKMLFQNEIARIIWEYKLSPDTINIAAKKWPELEVFRIELKSFELSQKVLKVIDSSIPYPILFIVTKGGLEKAIISYKEQSQNNLRFTKVDTYFETEWNDPVLAQIKIDGLDVDTVFDNFIRQIAGERLNIPNVRNAHQSVEQNNLDAKHQDTQEQCEGDYKQQDQYDRLYENYNQCDAHCSKQNQSNIKNDIECMKEREKLQKQIAALERRIKSEPSIGKKQQLAEEKFRLLQLMQE